MAPFLPDAVLNGLCVTTKELASHVVCCMHAKTMLLCKDFVVGFGDPNFGPVFFCCFRDMLKKYFV